MAWKFIQDKYVRKCYVPKNAVDPASEYRRQRTSGESDPSTDDSGEHTVKRAKPKREEIHEPEKSLKPPKAVKPVQAPLFAEPRKEEKKVEKVDLKDILDIDLGSNGSAAATKPAPAAPKPAIQSDIWDILGSGDGKPKVAKPEKKTESFLSNPLPPASTFYSCPQPNKYAALDQLNGPYSQFNSAHNPYWLGTPQTGYVGGGAYVPSMPGAFAPLPVATKAADKTAKGKLDSVFADILPSDFS